MGLFQTDVQVEIQPGGLMDAIRRSAKVNFGAAGDRLSEGLKAALAEKIEGAARGADRTTVEIRLQSLESGDQGERIFGFEKVGEWYEFRKAERVTRVGDLAVVRQRITSLDSSAAAFGGAQDAIDGILGREPIYFDQQWGGSIGE